MSISLYTKLIKMIFLRPADHQSVSEKGSCTVASMESSLKGSDGCSLKNNPRKDDHFLEGGGGGLGVHMSCLLNLKRLVQIWPGSRQLVSSRGLDVTYIQ